MTQARERRVTERLLLFFADIGPCRHQVVNIDLLGLSVSEGVVGFSDQRFFLFLFDDDAGCLVGAGVRCGVSIGCVRFHLLSVLLPLGNFSGQFCSIVGLCDKSLLFHQHLDAGLLVDHLLLVVHHFQTVAPHVQLIKLVSDFDTFASEWHRDLGSWTL